MGKAKPTDVVVNSREDADRALQQIAALRLIIDAEENSANEKIDDIRAELVEETKGPREALARYELALEEWAEANKKDLFTASRSMQLNFGTIGYRLTLWKIVILSRLKVETIIEKMRAAKMKSLFRTKEEIDREAAMNYLNSDLAKVGLKKPAKTSSTTRQRGRGEVMATKYSRESDSVRVQE